MNKKELLAKLDALAVEKRAFMASVENGTGEFDATAATAKIAEFEARKADLEKQLAEFDKPAETPAEKTVWRQLAEAMIEKRTVNLSGTGVVNTIKELVQKVVSKTDVLDGVRFFYGKDAATKVPVWGSQLKAHFVSEGSSSEGETNAMGVTTIDVQEILSSLPVSNMQLDLGAADLEAQLPDMFADAISDLFADGMCNGKVITVAGETVVAMIGVFTATNTSVKSGACTMVNLADFARNMASKKYNSPKIIMSNAVYTKFLADTSTDETTKLYKEGLIRDKKIEEVPVELTDYAPATGSGASGAWADDDVIAVAMDKSNYAIGMAGQLKIEKKGTAGSTVTTFDASAYAAGKPILAADIYQFKIDL